VRASIKRLKELEDMADSNKYEKINKKEILNLSREQEKLSKTLGGIKEMGGLPDALFVIDVGYEKIAVLEATKLGIPVVGVVDTNNSPDNIEYIVPGNDDSMRAIKLYTRLVADAILDGKQSIVTADANAELIEVEPDQDPVAKSSVKVTAKKASAAAAAASVAEPDADTKVATAEESAADESAKVDEVSATAEAPVETSASVETAKVDEVSATAEAPAETSASVETAEADAADVAVEAETATAPKKAAVKKAAVKKAAPKKAAAKKAATKKVATKKAATKKAAE
jgi:small subunit ribosomal protein S2